MGKTEEEDDQTLYKTMLYDFYSELLTEHQREIYEMYHFSDYSLGEISEVLGISRPGVHDALKRCGRLLEDLERKLHLVASFNRKKALGEQLEALASDLDPKMDPAALADRIARIQGICREFTDL
ncbi:YlxM family DNA-binding protein [Anaerotalea alkaliphila]|uniref:UPF0122 protein GXN74_10560 n=1 Tax=Anaerotalea alkaliphila TaxID=2662126 RepID=A0A7X5HX14_9FIRM|nr:YlxM family DNA-binding protein [Anaerotalea alkaliphila]NDL68182.1 YlxM family DNA-binding protein [Anaerotalea alkaliphila]